MIVVSFMMGTAFLLLGGSWWQAALVTGLALIFVWWAPRSGRYKVSPEKGLNAIQRDERTQAISDKAARNAWVVMMLSVAGLALYYGNTPNGAVPAQAINLLLLLG
jgi:uncharacterized membrane protein